MALLGAAIQRGVVASRPASGDASKAGQLYFATDEGKFWHDNGTSWVEVAIFDADLATIAGLSPSNDDLLQRKSGAWANRTLAQVKSDLALNNVPNLLNNLAATTDPAVTDDGGDGYGIGSRWINTTGDTEFVALDVTVGAAVWKRTTPSASGTDAEDIGYDNGASGLAATDVQAAIDELAAGGGGGGDETHTAATASRPAPSNAGDLFLPSDGGTMQRDTGSVWVPWGPLFPFTEPVDGDFSWVNQNSATKDTAHGGVYIEATPINGGKRLRVKTAPATPYVAVAHLIPTPIGANYQSYGIGFRESGSGKLHLLTFQYNSAGTPAGIALGSYKWDSATAFNSAYTLGAGGTTYAAERPPAFLHIADNGTNRRIGVSNDGQHPVWLHDVARTNYLTADQIGYFVDDGNAGVLMGAWLLSWEES